MKNVLVFKTASDLVMKNLFDELANSDNKVFCFIPSNCMDEYNERYKNVEFLDIKNKIFDEEKIEVSILKGVGIDEIYVPSDSPYFRNYEKVFFIIDKLKYHTMILYDCYGNKKYYKAKSKVQKEIQYVGATFVFWCFYMGYKLKNVLRGEE